MNFPPEPRQFPPDVQSTLEEWQRALIAYRLRFGDPPLTAREVAERISSFTGRVLTRQGVDQKIARVKRQLNREQEAREQTAG